jgi:hypothetical protein
MIALAWIPDDFSWWQLIMTLLSVMGTVFGLVKAAQSGIRKRVSRKWDQSYKDIQEVYTIIQELLSKSPANRVLVIKSENGGGIPTPDGVVTNSVIHEVWDPDTDAIQKNWTGIKLDRYYSEVVTKVSTDGVTDVAIKDLERSKFQDLLKACECSNARFIRICATRSALLYMCVCLGRDATLGPKERIHINTAARQLCDIFVHHHELIKKEART